MAEFERTEDIKQNLIDNDISDIKPRIESKEELDHNDSSRDLKNEPVEIISDDSLYVVPITNLEKETSDAELEAGLAVQAVLEGMAESVFNRDSKGMRPENISVANFG